MGGGSLLRPGTPEPQVTLTLGGREYSFTRARLGAFLLLAHYFDAILKAGKDGGNGGIADALYSYLSQAFDLSREEFEGATWMEVAIAYDAVRRTNALPDADSLALVRNAHGGRPARWTYPLREIIVWIDMLGRAYHWTRDDILGLFPEEAIALAQEIEARDYAERRFQHALSQVAYRLQGKKYVYEPLPEPYWMVMGLEPHKTLIDRRTLPQGNVIYPRNTPEDLRLH